MTETSITSHELHFRSHSWRTALVARRKSLAAVPTAVAHPCDAAALGTAVEAATEGLIAPILVGAGSEDTRCGGGGRRRHFRFPPGTCPPQPRRRPRGRPRPRGRGTAVDECVAAYRRIDARGHGHRHRPADRPSDQSRLHHGRAAISATASHHRCCRQHRAEHRRQAHIVQNAMDPGSHPRERAAARRD